MAGRRAHEHLSRRERQILDILYQRGDAGATEIQAGLPNRPSYSAVRTLLRILEEKGHVRHQEREGRYIYTPTVPADRAKKSALSHLVKTFFNGSPHQAMAALLDVSPRNLTRQELDRMAALIAKARKEGR